jgi:UDP-N-acetyl-D-glucosamine dehydrogenase
MGLATAATERLAEQLKNRIRDRAARVGVMGLGYVGLPLAVSFAEKGFRTVGFEIDTRRLSALRAKRSYVDDLSKDTLTTPAVEARFVVTNQFRHLAELDAIIVCLPTPLGKARTPDLSALINSFSEIQKYLRAGQLIILSSTTYPGTTEELALPILEATGLRVGQEYFLAYSPERIDPGNKRFRTKDIPRVVGGVTKTCTELAELLLQNVVGTVYKVSTCRAAEMTKLLENTFRSVNIALANEMAIICGKIGIDIWEVLDAAATKPFGFMRFDPGPGLGGHCIPIDPVYLSWKLRELKYRARFVELAEDINGAMPDYVVNLVARALNDRGQSLRGARILAIGLAYKRNVGDARESPAIEVVKQLTARGAVVLVHDAFVEAKHSSLGFAVQRQELSNDMIQAQDCVVILTDHSSYDWLRVLANARLVVDTRGITRRVRCDQTKVIRL